VVTDNLFCHRLTQTGADSELDPGVLELPQYLDEFQHRFNLRRVCDEERFASLMGQTQGRVLWYCQTPQPENPYA